MSNLLLAFTEKITVAILLALSAIGHSVNTPVIPAGQSKNISSDPAIIFETLPQLPNISITGSLPTATISFCTADSSCGIKALKALAAAAVQIAKTISASAVLAKPLAVAHSVLTISSSTIATAISSAQHIISQTISTPAIPITAQNILNNTTVTFEESIDGPYHVIFQSSLGGGNTVSWNPLSTTIGESGNMPPFSVSVSCDPTPNSPDSSAIDQTPLFAVSTKYDCNVSLTPTSGADRRTQSKDISFTVPAGELMVSPLEVYNNVLVNDTNNSGIVFNNENNAPVTVTGVTLDVSFSYLDASQSPLVLRLSDPLTDSSLFDYHLENAPQNPAAAYTNLASGVNASPLQFTIPANTQKMIPVSILGVKRMLMSGTQPTVSVTVRSVTTAEGVKVILRSPVIRWSCTVALTGYNPNATSDVFATGEACLD